MRKFTCMEDLAAHYGFEVKTAQDMTRLDKAWRMYLEQYRGDGCNGCISEVLGATSGSNKSTVSNSGRADTHIKWRTASGRIDYIAAEWKTNGGRLETIESEFSRAERLEGRFVIYSLDICNAGTNHQRRHVPAVVIPRRLFVAKLAEINGIKAINKHGALDGYGIQATSKKWYQWLLEWPIVYDRDAVYTADDFEGLE